MTQKILLIVVVIFFYSNTIAQHKVDVSQLTKETQISNNANGVIEIVWWLPTEFWEASFAASGKSTPETDNFLENLSQYNIIGVVKGKTGMFGNVTYTDTDSIKNNLFVYSEFGKMTPLNESEIKPEVTLLLEIFKPILKNMLGDLGENFNFYVFDAYKNNKRLFNPKEKGIFKIELLKKNYNIHLPLGSLLPPKYCKKCNEEMNGGWEYCPYHGKKLKEK